MSRRIVGYEGEGKRRRPVYSDPIEADLSGNPPGPVTRRVATDAERGGFASRVQGPGLIRLPRHSPLITPPKAIAEPPVTEPEEPVMEPVAVPPTEEPRDLTRSIRELVMAANAADEAWTAFDAADTARIHAEEAWAIARGNLRRAWEGVRPVIEPGAEITEQLTGELAQIGLQHVTVDESVAITERTLARLAEQRHEQLLNGDDRPAVVESPADHAETIPVPDPTSRPAAAFAAFSRDKAAAAGGGPATKQDRILAAVVPNGGDLRAVAAANNTTPGNVTATLHNAGKRHRLTADMIAVLPASFAKYSGV